MIAVGRVNSANCNTRSVPPSMPTGTMQAPMACTPCETGSPPVNMLSETACNITSPGRRPARQYLRPFISSITATSWAVWV